MQTPILRGLMTRGARERASLLVGSRFTGRFPKPYKALQGPTRPYKAVLQSRKVIEACCAFRSIQVVLSTDFLEEVSAQSAQQRLGPT
ncbi:MAG: hypothetical protein ACI87O_002366 [Planctomycetota bacterium]|jgi:hypothetical protein